MEIVAWYFLAAFAFSFVAAGIATIVEAIIIARRKKKDGEKGRSDPTSSDL